MNIEKMKNAYFGMYTKAKRMMISRYTRKVARGHLKNPDILTAEERQAAIDFWKPYLKIDPVFHAFFKETTGRFHPDWVPTDVYINNLDEYFNDRNASHILDNKSLYEQLFPGIPKIPVITCRRGGLWYNGQNQIISYEEAVDIVCQEDAVFVKAATLSSGGAGVNYICAEQGDLREQFAQAISSMRGDIVVQRPFRQHPVFAALNKSSVNTLRIMSVLSESGAKIYVPVVRIGVGDTKVDNACAGGVFCGIRDDGTLKDTAYRLNGESFKKHPTSGIVFEGYQLEGLEKAKALVRKAHPMIPFFRMVSWDIVIDEQGEAYMLEVNFAKSGNEPFQFTEGPLLGEDLRGYLDEIFRKKNK